jgi:XTP/dITP diphosphohydrolase
MKLVFATHNRHKFDEVKAMLPSHIQLLSLSDIQFHEDIPEDFDTLDANAMQKAETVKALTGFDCFADDTGLEIDALNGNPGVYSARYAGPEKDAAANTKKVLNDMENCQNRNARFRCVIALIIGSKKYSFEGVVNGTIQNTAEGTQGFGYDPIFKPQGYDCTFAEMPLSEKNKISHRAKAFMSLYKFLEGHLNA